MTTTRIVCIGFAFLFATGSLAAAQDRKLSRCFAITDLNERIDCLESGGIASTPDTGPIPTVRSPKQPHAEPSFDCRSANNSIERAICGDPILSEWDFRMGQQYQHTLRSSKDADTQPITESQRAWLLQRNARCGAVGDTAIWTCLLDMTKQRIDVLAKLSVAGTKNVPIVQAQVPTEAAPKNLSGTVPSALPSSPTNSSNTLIAKIDASAGSSSAGSNSLLIVLFIIGAVVGGIAVVGNIRRKQHRQSLVAKYGEEAADMILAHQVWQGMTEEQLIESWGLPADKDFEVKRSTTKETWKYGQTGKNRFKNRVYLENGTVIGWKI
jgi:uncharacterized protein YecT (DUF1311 family)